MNTDIDWSTVCELNNVKPEDCEEAAEINQLCTEAKSFIQGFQWCIGINRHLFGIGAGKVFAVFLFEIASLEADPLLWVIVGDIPPAYIVTDNARSPTAALKRYIEEMRLWVNAVVDERDLEGVIPVDARPTKKNAMALESRLAFLETEFLPLYEDGF